MAATAHRTPTIEELAGQHIRLAPNYWPFVIPALVVVLSVIVFPWVFTIWMSTQEFTLGQERHFVGGANYARLWGDPRFWESLVHTLWYTLLSVVLPLFLGTLAALVFDSKFPLRGFLRGIFVMPMMATPVAIAPSFSSPTSITTQARARAANRSARRSRQRSSTSGAVSRSSRPRRADRLPPASR